MRRLLFLLAACGGSKPEPAVQNTAPPRCTVIPHGTYSFGAGASAEAVLDTFDVTGVPDGTCKTAFDGKVQSISCEQASSRTTLRGTFEPREGVHLKSDTYSGTLEYSDAVVLLGTLTNPAGESLYVRLELSDCKTVEDCLQALQNARKCE